MRTNESQRNLWRNLSKREAKHKSREIGGYILIRGDGLCNYPPIFSTISASKSQNFARKCYTLFDHFGFKSEEKKVAARFARNFNTIHEGKKGKGLPSLGNILPSFQCQSTPLHIEKNWPVSSVQCQSQTGPCEKWYIYPQIIASKGFAIVLGSIGCQEWAK